jgi:hypothetical protein
MCEVQQLPVAAPRLGLKSNQPKEKKARKERNKNYIENGTNRTQNNRVCAAQRLTGWCVQPRDIG